MLEAVFLQILNMSFTASLVILAVIAARILLKRAPKIFSYALWSVVLFRLVCPFSFESTVGLLGAKAIPDNIALMQTPQISTGIPMLNDSINAVLPAATPAASMNPIQGIVAIGTFLWLCGIAALVIYSGVSLLLLKRKLKDAFCEGGNLYYTNGFSSPFVLGLFRPKIYLPANLTEDETQYILLHEQTHIRRLDHVAKLVGFAALCLHWFNPLAWVAFFLFGRDMELSCDEAVIKKLGSNVKKSYSSSLLTLATGRHILGGSPLAFGEGDTKSRIKNVLHYKKPTFWVIAVAIVAVIALAVVLVSNPAQNKEQEIESATQVLLARDSSYTVVEESYLYGDAVLLLASAPNPEAPEFNMGYGVFVMKKVDGVYTLVASAESEPSMSLGFAAALLKWNGLTVVFGDLGERYWDFRTDEVTQVEYTKVRAIYDGGEQSVPVTNNTPYLLVIEGDVQISDVEYYAKDTLVTSYMENYSEPLSLTEEVKTENLTLTGETVSPNQRYEVTIAGINENIVSGGRHPAKTMRILDTGSGEVLWEDMGYYAQSVLWSSDSHYVAITRSGRAYVETIVLETDSFTSMLVPLPIAPLPELDGRLDYAYIQATQWKSNQSLQLHLEDVTIELQRDFICSISQGVSGQLEGTSNYVNADVSNVKTEIETSAKFTQQEIEQAFIVVKEKFQTFENCQLNSLQYDEEKSNTQVASYLVNGKGSANGAVAENTIVLFSEFYVNSNASGAWEPDSDYSWMFILIRDNKDTDWVVDDMGY